MSEDGWNRVEKKKSWKDRERDKHGEGKDWNEGEEDWIKVGRKSGWENGDRSVWEERANLERIRTSYAVAARRGRVEKRNEGDAKCKNETFPKSGPPGFKEEDEKELKVRPITYNGRAFSGYVTHVEAVKNIYEESMKLKTCNLHGVSFIRNMDDDLTIVFKLKTGVEPTLLQKKFDYQRKNKAGRIDWIGCIVENLCLQECENQADIYKHVKIEGCGYQLSEEELTKWLELFGKIIEPIEEETFVEVEGGDQFGNGRYVVRMKIEKEIPELIPMFDQKVKIHYSGIKKICKNCLTYHKGECQQQNAKWSDYVGEFVKENSRIPPDMITRSGRVDEEKSKTSNRTVQEEMEIWDQKEDEAEESDAAHQNKTKIETGGTVPMSGDFKENIHWKWRGDSTWNESQDEEEPQEEDNIDPDVLLCDGATEDAKVEVEQEAFKEIDIIQYEKIYNSMFELCCSKSRKEKKIQRLNKSCMDEIRSEVKETLLKSLRDQKIRVVGLT